MRVAGAYLRLAVDFAVEMKEIEYLDALEKMAFHAIEADRREEGVYTQPWLLGKTYSFKTSSKIILQAKVLYT